MRDVKNIEFTHSNCYWFKVETSDINTIVLDEDVIRVILNKNYKYIDEGFRVWESIKPFDKDEITHIRINKKDGYSIDRYVPFKNVSNHGSYNENSKSRVKETDNYIEIIWNKHLE